MSKPVVNEAQERVLEPENCQNEQVILVLRVIINILRWKYPKVGLFGAINNALTIPEQSQRTGVGYFQHKMLRMTFQDKITLYNFLKEQVT